MNHTHMKDEKFRVPNAFSASEIATWPTAEEYEPGRWRPSRPCSWNGLCLRKRLVMAWHVFMGEVDVLYWGAASGQQLAGKPRQKSITEPDFKRVV